MKSDLPQGTVDLLSLKTVALEMAEGGLANRSAASRIDSPAVLWSPCLL